MEADNHASIDILSINNMESIARYMYGRIVEVLLVKLPTFLSSTSSWSLRCIELLYNRDIDQLRDIWLDEISTLM